MRILVIRFLHATKVTQPNCETQNDNCILMYCRQLSNLLSKETNFYKRSYNTRTARTRYVPDTTLDDVVFALEPHPFWMDPERTSRFLLPKEAKTPTLDERLPVSFLAEKYT
ncbi:hypothetical protein CEXT_385751 [Caerostris extrusa]|uniref:Uncharacterized protein n=1 Tax=Caerostris extrusa TaxID=172846 RepID=A0AAV4WEF3_CAEEX|nr:hypothetical protein CEXT_385751 [Caerostris extrusa]